MNEILVDLICFSLNAFKGLPLGDVTEVTIQPHVPPEVPEPLIVMGLQNDLPDKLGWIRVEFPDEWVIKERLSAAEVTVWKIGPPLVEFLTVPKGFGRGSIPRIVKARYHLIERVLVPCETP